MSEIGVDHQFFLGPDLIERRELRRRRANVIHQTDGHESLGANPGGKVLVVNVAEFCPEGVRFGVIRVTPPKMISNLRVSTFRKIHFPNSLVVAQKRIHGSGQFDVGERATRQG